MKKLMALVLVLSFILPLTACGNPGGVSDNTEYTPVIKDTDALDKDALTATLETLRSDNHIAGMAVAVTDGEAMIYQQGFGVDDVNAPDVLTSPNSLFRIASISKTYTALMVMRLCEEGILDLDTPVKSYIPTFTLSNPKAAETITLRQLLTHTAGLPGDDVMSSGSKDESTMNKVIQTMLPLLTISMFEGEYRYSTWGYNVIGYVASTVTGKPLSQLIKEYVTDPLGMEVTTFDNELASNAKYPLSLPHKMAGGTLRTDHMLINTAFNAGAGLYSNTADMCKLARFFLNGGVTDSGERLLSEDTFQNMIAPQVKASETSAYGFGVQLWDIDGRQYYGHNGTYYGQNYRCSLYVDRETGYGVITLMNSASTVEDLRRVVPLTVFDILNQKN